MFDYLIGNFDRHFGNIGVDANTGDLSPFYDHAAGLQLSDENRESLIYDVESEKRVAHRDIPLHLIKKIGITYVSKFYTRCSELNVYNVLLKVQTVMGNQSYEEYEEILPELLNSGINWIKDAVILAAGGKHGSTLRN